MIVRFRKIPLALIVLGTLVMRAAMGDDPSAETPSGPGMTPDLINQGREYFAASCPQCHGDDAHGNGGPDLHRLPISDARIALTIKKGIEGRMPAFAKRYDDQQVAALVTYLRTLR